MAVVDLIHRDLIKGQSAPPTVAVHAESHPHSVTTLKAAEIEGVKLKPFPHIPGLSTYDAKRLLQIPIEIHINVE